jgi:hypothetical protein
LEIAGALVLVGAVVGWYFIGVNTTTTGAPNTTVTVTQRADASRSATGESGLSGSWHDYKLRVVDRRVGDCFDLNDPSADEIEDVKAVPCTTKHEFEVFYVGAMGEGSYPTDDAFGTYVTQNCTPAFGAYIGKAYDDSDLFIYWLVPTDDAWRVGRSDRAVRRLLSAERSPDTVAPGRAAVSPAVGPRSLLRAERLTLRHEVDPAADGRAMTRWPGQPVAHLTARLEKVTGLTPSEILDSVAQKYDSCPVMGSFLDQLLPHFPRADRSKDEQRDSCRRSRLRAVTVR